MTERNVRRGMVVATIGVAGLLTALAVAGLIVITKGPQVQALPLVRTLIAPEPGGGGVAETLTPATADHPPLTWPQPLQTTTTTPVLASLGETSADGPNAATYPPSMIGSTVYTYVPPNLPSYSAPPSTSGALTPPASGAPAPAPASDVTPRTGAASSAGHSSSTGGGSAAVDPVTSTTQPVEVKAEDLAAQDDDREVISPRLRVSTADDDDPDDPDDPDDTGK